MNDTNINSFITILLNKNPDYRLKGSYTCLKKHPMFESIDWVIAF